MGRRNSDWEKMVLLILTIILIALAAAIVHSAAEPEEEECTERSSREEAMIQEIVLFIGEGRSGSIQEPPPIKPRTAPIVEVAQGEIGNEGGEKYWSWYGFSQRVEWCACFVSWCANECGYIEAGILPKFSVCDSSWLKEAGLWQENSYEPSAGDLIFFDWMVDGYMDGSEDHVGIVEYVDETWVYTIEGNSSDRCARQKYEKTDPQILGYAVFMPTH